MVGLEKSPSCRIGRTNRERGNHIGLLREGLSYDLIS